MEIFIHNFMDLQLKRFLLLIEVMKKKILILCANPRGTSRLRLDEEVREIEEGLKRAKLRDQFDIQSKLALRSWDLRRALLEFEPHIVHFAGNGGKSGLMIENKMGFSARISTEALSGLFELCAHHVECVILNACFSESQADAINKHIKYVIGMKKQIKDGASTEFAVGIYDALGAGRSFEDAFKFGCNAIHNICPGLQEHLTPVLKNNEARTRDTPGPDSGSPVSKMNEAPPTGHTTVPSPSRGRKRPGKLTQVVILASILGVCSLLFIHLSLIRGPNADKDNENENDIPEISGNTINQNMVTEDMATEEDRLEEEFMRLGQLMAYSLKNRTTGYTAGANRMNLLFLFNRGPDVYLEDFFDPLRRYIYKRIVKAASKTILSSIELSGRIFILELNLNSLEIIHGQRWLGEIDLWPLNPTLKKHAVYEILLSVNRVTGTLQIGGRLIVENQEHTAAGEETRHPGSQLTHWNNIPAPHLIKAKSIPISDKIIEGDILETLVKKTGGRIHIDIKGGSKDKNDSKDDLVAISSGDKINIVRPLYFRFTMPGDSRYLIILVKDGSGNIGNLVPGTANALTNGDYFISNEPQTHYTDILRDKVIVNHNNGRVDIGPYYPNKTGETMFFFFFLNKRNQLIEDMGREADFPAGRDIEIKRADGKPIRHLPSTTHKDDLEHVLCRKIILMVKQP